MVQLLDKDGDGEVSQDEYKVVYMSLFPKTTLEEFNAIWMKMDADGDGNLTVQELAKFYGFDLEGSSSTEMTDEQILQALQLQAALVEQNAEKDKKIQEEKKKAEEKEEEERKAKGTEKKINAVDLTIKQMTCLVSEKSSEHFLDF